MKLIAVTAEGFYGFDQQTRFNFVENRIICVGANGTGKSNVLRLVEMFLRHGTGLNTKLHWQQGDSIWESHKSCHASLHFELSVSEQEMLCKWRLISILAFISTEPNVQVLVEDLERQDLEDITQAFCVVEIVPQDAEDVYGLENSPLFRKLKADRTSTKRVRLLWDMLEKALLAIYSEKKPYDAVVYTAHTEPRDQSSVVFDQILCDGLDRDRIVSELEAATLSSDARVIIPNVLTLENEMRAIKSVLCPFSSDGGPHTLDYRGTVFTTIATQEMWSRIEGHLRYGITQRVSAAPASAVGIDAPPVSSKKVKLVGDMNLVNCAFLTPPNLTSYPRVESIEDVRTQISRLVLLTEQYMRSRPSGCHMENIRGITSILRRLLLNSVCVVPQDRTEVGDGTYLCLTVASVQERVTKLMESTARSDVRAVSRMQLAMKTITGHEIKSHRYLDSGSCVVGMQSLHRTSKLVDGGLKNVGGGQKELLLVVTALHGVGADTVVLDSPGFSLHPPQQKALALWISKCIYENAHAPSLREVNPPLSVLLISNSTEFLTEDSLPCLYCFQRTIANCVQSFRCIKGGGGNGGSLSTNGTPVYEKPASGARVSYFFPPGTEIRCRGRRNHFSELIDGSGFISLNDVIPANSDDCESEIVTRVKPLISGNLTSSDGLKLLDPSLKRLVFASGVFLFEGQSDYRVIEALKHVASGVTWEVVMMHGAGEVSKIVKIVESLGIPYGVVVDYDQIMPTQHSRKHNNEATMTLWRSSTIYRLMVDQIQMQNPRKPLTPKPAEEQVEDPSKSGGKRYGNLNSPAKMDWKSSLKHTDSVKNLDDLVDLLTNFNSDNGDNAALSEQLAAVTSELKQYIQTNQALESLNVHPSAQTSKFAPALKDVEAIINDSNMHPSIRAALLRKKLRSVGIFAWNSDLEGMIFGYGYALHDAQVVNSMPQSIKEFCMEEKEFLSGIAYERYVAQYYGGSPSDRDPQKDDVDRISYLVETSSTGKLTSRELSKLYKMAFGCRFRGEIGGVHYPFSNLVDRLKQLPSIKVTVLENLNDYLDPKDDDETASVDDGEALENLIDEDEIVEEVPKKHAVAKPEKHAWPPLAPSGKHHPGSTEEMLAEIGVAQGSIGTGTNSNNDEKKKSFVGIVKNNFDVLINDEYDEAETKPSSQISHRGPQRYPSRRGDSRSRSPMPISAGSRDGSKSSGRGSNAKPNVDTNDAVYEDGAKEYLFEWVGEPGARNVLKEHPQHIFKSPSYWRFVGSVLHGGRERAGLWRHLPWVVLKDVIFCAKNIKVPDNKSSKYMSPDELGRYGKSLSSAPVHLGLRDLLDWMVDMETKGAIPS